MLSWSPALRGRSLLTLLDVTAAEMLELIDLAIALKARRRQGIRGRLLDRRQIALIFEKSSTRTRTAATVAVCDEGGSAEYLSRGDIHLGAKESVADTARVLGRMFDGIVFRGYEQATVEGLARHAGVPVWLVGGIGRMLPGRMFDGLRLRVEPDDPWEADDEFVPLDLVDRIVGPRGPESVTEALQRIDCPVAPELFKGIVL
jgi:hypothetical protein